MSKLRLNDEATLILCENLGMAIGSILPAIVQFPPTSPEAAKLTAEALTVVFKNSVAHGAPPHARVFMNAAITAIEHYAGHETAVSGTVSKRASSTFKTG